MKKIYVIAFVYLVPVIHVGSGSPGELREGRMKALTPFGAEEKLVFHDITAVKVNPMLLIYFGKVWHRGTTGAHTINYLDSIINV